jgi:hypothetical protein
LLERKRRARINRCLDELKDLMVGALEVGIPNYVQLYFTSSLFYFRLTDSERMDFEVSPKPRCQSTLTGPGKSRYISGRSWMELPSAGDVLTMRSAVITKTCVPTLLLGTGVRPPLWSSGQSSWLQIQRSRVRFLALPAFLSSSGSGTGST